MEALPLYNPHPRVSQHSGFSKHCLSRFCQAAWNAPGLLTTLIAKVSPLADPCG